MRFHSKKSHTIPLPPRARSWGLKDPALQAQERQSARAEGGIVSLVTKKSHTNRFLGDVAANPPPGTTKTLFRGMSPRSPLSAHRSPLGDPQEQGFCAVSYDWKPSHIQDPTLFLFLCGVC